jgi:hypothetical protein
MLLANRHPITPGGVAVASLSPNLDFPGPIDAELPGEEDAFVLETME